MKRNGNDKTKGLETTGSFTSTEERFLQTERLLGRVATVGADGVPHVTPVGMWSLTDGSIEVRGHGLDETKKFRDVRLRGTAAISIDDVPQTDGWSPRAVLVRGRADAVEEPEPLIRIHPDRVISWGLEENEGKDENEKEKL
ncbi:MAG: PPOX class F420-dependent oxidoreductase [Acidimicrobiia bacterium]|nr:PPOX class F420-dependent oxidoreductase [Acidimicrobiia bacterium]